jgi:cysteine-rich repeat protein
VATCGDGVVTPPETCDTGIASGPGSCPTSCDDHNACTTDLLNDGGTCTASCEHVTITTPADGDGCCPTGANAGNDSDCPPGCGDGVVTPPETCDTGIASGPGSCPTACDDHDACTTDALVNGGTCTAACQYAPITAPANGDGCCPAGANAGNDNDCAASCGDGVVTAPETCDIAIPSGPGSCPTSCDDGDACTTDALVGGGTCTATCQSTPITIPADGDHCCPPGANSTNDSDCAPACGNNVVEPGEGCDDGNTSNGDGCSSTCQIELTAYRVTSMTLVDPHIFPASLGCADLTSFVNTTLNNNLTGDANGDGLLDLSPVAIFEPLAQSSPTSTLAFQLGECKKDNSGCVGGTAPEYPANETNIGTGTCALDSTGHNGAYGAVNTPINSCFFTDAETIEISLQGVNIKLQDARIAAVYSGNPATGLTTGVVRGFLSKADADAITLPPTVPIVGGSPLSSLLGSDTNCTSHNDLDTFGTVKGWYFYLNFTATKTVYAP